MKQKQGFFTAKNIATLAVFIAVMLVIDITHLGYFTLGVISVTSMHIPVVIGALYGGTKYGAVLGTAFGLTSMIRSMQGGAGLMTPFFMNPLVSILPRLLFGLFVGWLGERLRDRSKMVHYALPAFIGTFLHTCMVMGAIYFIYAKNLMEMTGQGLKAVRAMILAVFVTNGLPEAVFAAILAFVICGALEMRNQRKRK